MDFIVYIIERLAKVATLALVVYTVVLSVCMLAVVASRYYDYVLDDKFNDLCDILTEPWVMRLFCFSSIILNSLVILLYYFGFKAL